MCIARENLLNEDAQRKMKLKQQQQQQPQQYDRDNWLQSMRRVSTKQRYLHMLSHTCIYRAHANLAS